MKWILWGIYVNFINVNIGLKGNKAKDLKSRKGSKTVKEKPEMKKKSGCKLGMVIQVDEMKLGDLFSL